MSHLMYSTGHLQSCLHVREDISKPMYKVQNIEEVEKLEPTTLVRLMCCTSTWKQIQPSWATLVLLSLLHIRHPVLNPKVIGFKQNLSLPNQRKAKKVSW